MEYRVELAPSAREDFRGMLAYIAEDNPMAARTFGSRVLGQLKQLRTYPRSGRIVPEYDNADMREIIVQPYRIVYRVREKESLVQVARIWHAARGIPDLPAK